MGENVLLTRDGVIATVTLNRPDRRNSLSDPMLTELGAAFAELRDDAATRVVIVTGAPPVFSAGADAGLKSSMSPEERRQRDGRAQEPVPPALRARQHGARGPRADDDRRHQRPRRRRRLGSHAGLRLPHRGAPRPSSGSPRSISACRWGSPRPRASCGWSAPRGPRRSSWTAGATPPTRRGSGAS